MNRLILFFVLILTVNVFAIQNTSEYKRGYGDGIKVNMTDDIRTDINNITSATSDSQRAAAIGYVQGRVNIRCQMAEMKISGSSKDYIDGFLDGCFSPLK